tara:strand:+ start:4099 stop:4428 length:330 start_codon:yes stop_codon:yes gene_type:complete
MGVVTAAIIGATIAAGAGAITANAAAVKSGRRTRTARALQDQLRVKGRRRDTAQLDNQKQADIQKNKVAQATQNQANNMSLDLKGIEQRGAPQAAGFAGVTSNVLAEPK